jgi:glycosyltransferase involved in cell wall biosynthesis
MIEASFAPKQAGGRWDLGHRATAAALRRADVVLGLTKVDLECLAPLVRPPARLRHLPPFLDPAPYAVAHAARQRHRSAIAARWSMDPGLPWLLTVAMMRADVKRDSYLLLAGALDRLRDRPWQILVIGDGPARPEIEAAFAPFGDRAVFAGTLPEAELPPCYAACDLFVWPAVREAYGLAMLEAQAAGLPVVAGQEGGVAEVVRHDVTGILTPPRDPQAFAQSVATLLADDPRRHAMAAAARRFVTEERSLDRAAAALLAALHDATAIQAARA